MYTFYYTAWWRHFWWWALFTGLRSWWNILLRFRSLILTLLWSEMWEYLFLHLHHHQCKQRVIIGTLVRTKQVQLPYLFASILKMILPVGMPARQESSKVNSQSRDFRFIFDEKW